MIDSEEGGIWQRPLSQLSASLNEQLQSTNMEFYQNGNNLYIIGGYGFSATANNHITYPNLTIVDLSGLEQALINNQPITNYFRQITDQRMAVTGGHLGMFGDEFVLVCGQRFDGRYNPHGPLMAPAFRSNIPILSDVFQFRIMALHFPFKITMLRLTPLIFTAETIILLRLSIPVRKGIPFGQAFFSMIRIYHT